MLVFWKTLAPIDVRPLGSLTPVSLTPWKAKPPIYVTPFGITIFFPAKHVVQLKAYPHIDVRVVGSAISGSFEQFRNAESPIFVTLLKTGRTSRLESL